MEYGAIDLHKKESRIRIVTESGEGTVKLRADTLNTSPLCRVLRRTQRRHLGARSTEVFRNLTTPDVPTTKGEIVKTACKVDSGSLARSS